MIATYVNKMLQHISQHIPLSITMIITMVGITLNATYPSAMGVLANFFMIMGVIIVTVAEHVETGIKDGTNRMAGWNNICFVGILLCAMGIFFPNLCFSPISRLLFTINRFLCVKKSFN